MRGRGQSPGQTRVMRIGVCIISRGHEAVAMLTVNLRRGTSVSDLQMTSTASSRLRELRGGQRPPSVRVLASGVFLQPLGVHWTVAGDLGLVLDLENHSVEVTREAREVRAHRLDQRLTSRPLTVC